MGNLNKAARARKGDALTRRELEILSLLADGNTTPDISRLLRITDATIKTHLTAMYKKIGVRNRVEATLYYLERYGSSAHATRP